MIPEITQDLIKFTNGVVANLCRAYRVPDYDREEIMGECQLGLARFTKTYKPDRGLNFKTYVKYRLHGLVIDCIRKEMGRNGFSKKPRFVSINHLLTEEFKSESLRTNGTMDKVAAKDLAFKILSKLPKKQALILKLYYLSGMTQLEISKVLSVTDERISQLMKKAIKESRRVACWL